MERKSVRRFTGLWRLILLFVVFFTGGCATLSGADIIKPMAITEQTNALDLQKEPVALLTLRTSNRYKPGYQPIVWGIFISTDDDKKEKVMYKIGNKLGALIAYDTVEKEYNEYLVSISLPAGKYKIRNINGKGGTFPVSGAFYFPVYVDFELIPDKVLYLGRIEATLRERKNDSELRAGPVIPAVDQAMTGFYSGTFDVSIYDNYDKDIDSFKKEYPVLNNLQIEKAILPPWKQPTEEEMKK